MTAPSKIAVCGWCGIELPTMPYASSVMDDHAYTAAHFAGFHRAPGSSSVRYLYPATVEQDFYRWLESHDTRRETT